MLYIFGDKNDFILPEDLEMQVWENIYGPFQEDDEEIPFVQVPEQYRVTLDQNLCIICLEGLATHVPVLVALKLCVEIVHLNL